MASTHCACRQRYEGRFGIKKKIQKWKYENISFTIGTQKRQSGQFVGAFEIRAAAKEKVDVRRLEWVCELL